ncbi:Candidate beta-glycosidase Glycoside hydrolase family 3 [Mesorhizobium loti]|nr:Candidate beta-glycosidase Glycoside hydrolase family 3 [Mesorhizobium loti]
MEIVGDEDGEDHQHEDKHEPDEVVEDELQGLAGAGVHELIRLAHAPENGSRKDHARIGIAENWLRAEKARSVSGDVPIRRI